MERIPRAVAWLATLVASVGCHFHSDPFQPNHQSVNMFNDDMFRSSGLYQYVNVDRMDDDIPIIIWWTGRLFVANGVKLLNCPNSVCYSTADRSYIKDPRTRGFYFYGTDLDPEDMPFPRKPHHEWALFHEESPMNNYMLVHNTMLKLFNHTSTFRRESDYPITTHSLNSLEYLMQRKPVPIEEKNKARREGLAPVLYIQSHCDVASDRDRYIIELMKYIEVDSVGQCLHNKDLPESLRDPVNSMDSPKLHDLISKYKFHIAYENAICKDYMTEKLFRPFHVGSVPVYKGSSRVKDWIPNNKSIILIDDFSGPKELAAFLKHLDENDEEYESYISYKRDGINNTYLIENIRNRAWGLNVMDKPNPLEAFECHVCDLLTKRHQNELLHKSDSSVPLLPTRTANASHLNCPQPYPSIGDIQDISSTDDSWLKQMWIGDYWGGLDKAEALRNMILNGEKDPRLFLKYWKQVEKERFMP